MLPSVHNPNSISIDSAVFAQLTADSPYTSQWAAPSCPQKCPFAGRNWNPHLMHGSLGPPKSTPQMESRLVQPFLQGSRSWQTDRPTDHITPSLTIGCSYVRSTVMQLKKTVSTHSIMQITVNGNVQINITRNLSTKIKQLWCNRWYTGATRLAERQTL